MKKMLLVFIVAVLLCGCQNTGPEYLISGIGVDVDNGQYSLCFEAIIVNTENTEQSVKLLKGKGNTVKEAVEQIKKQCTQPLLMAHCGVVAVGQEVSRAQLKEVGQYCQNGGEITLSAYFVRTENAEKLLSVKPVSSASVGYDIMGLVKRNKKFNNRFFEVINSDYKNSLPKISLKNKGLNFNG